MESILPMPTLISHGIATTALITCFPKRAVPRRLMVAAIICSIVPDIDVVGYQFGLRHGELLGHRGVTHSILFAVILATAAFQFVLPTLDRAVNRSLVWTYLFLATASHGLLDALTDRSGLGIPFFWPFDNTRYFFPFAPIAMSPIGASFFSERGWLTLLSEARWVWIPSLVFALSAISVRYFLSARSAQHRLSSN